MGESSSASVADKGALRWARVVLAGLGAGLVFFSHQVTNVNPLLIRPSKYAVEPTNQYV